MHVTLPRSIIIFVVPPLASAWAVQVRPLEDGWVDGEMAHIKNVISRIWFMCAIYILPERAMSVARCLRYVARRAYNSSMARRKIQHSGASSYTTQAELTVTNGGRQLRAVWKEAWPSVYHAIWLRHNCQCSSCLCEHSNQLSIQPHELDPQVKILDLKLKGLCS